LRGCKVTEGGGDKMVWLDLELNGAGLDPKGFGMGLYQ
ncbi:MAG: hypothetical protein JWM99_3732, partial [Verrucomicrobiales bacterium]|nr:hypothetical protein [Verrucomicrobiales bacterium]